MPNMADIVVKKADGTTNVTYVGVAPSAGDKTPAVWTLNAQSGIQGLRPRLEMLCQPNGNSTTRQARFKYFYPVKYTDTTTSLDKLLNSVGFDGVVHLPTVLSTTDWNEAWNQLGNLLSSTLIRSAVQEGYSPT